MAGIIDLFIDSCGCECIGAGKEVELHSDYAIKVTPLYKAVENLQWASVNNYLKTGFWKNSFFADPVKPDVQVKTWMVRYEEVNVPSDNVNSGSTGSRVQKTIKKICWKQLPMHAAIVNGAPAIIIQKLINAYPKALRCADNRGNLPIHLAFRHGSNDAVLALLLQEYPEGMNCRETNGLLPTECATQLPSPQPLRGALLKAASPRNGKDRLQLVKQLSNDRLFFDDRANTPHRGNLSPKKDPENAPQPPPSQFSMLSQQMESLRDTVTRALSKSDTGVDTPVATNTTATVKSSASHELSDVAQFFPSSKPPSSSSVPSPPVANTKTTPLSPTAMESLQDIVSQTLAGSFSHFAVDPDDMDSVSELSAKNLSTTGAVSSPNHKTSNNNAGGVRHPNQNHLNQPSYHQQNNNNWLRDGYDNMELPQNSILETTGGGGYNTSIPQPQAMLPQLQASWEPQNHLYGQQQQPLPQRHQYAPMQGTGSYEQMNTQPQTQFHQPPPPPPQIYNLVSPQHHLPPHHQQQQQQQSFQSQKQLQEQQQKLDDEVRIMEEKMTTMELAMKQMHQREKTVRKELAMTVQEMRLWKEKANKATVEEEKNRILTEMLQKFASSPRVQPQEQTHQSSLTTHRHSNKNQSVSKSLSKRHSRSNDDETDDDESEPPVIGNIMTRNKSGVRPAVRHKSPSRHKSPKRRSPPVPETTDDENESEAPLTPAELEQVYRLERKNRQQRTASPKRSTSRRRGGGSRDDDDDYNYKARSQDQRDDMGGGAYYDQTVDRYNNGQQRQRSPKRGNNNSKIKNWNSRDEPPAVPLHRVNEGKMYGAPPPPPPPPKRTVGFAPAEQSGPVVADHLLMRRPRSHQPPTDPNAAIRITRQHRSYGDPLGTHLESDSQVPGYGYEDDADSSQFSESMMEKIAGLQNRQGHPHGMTAIEYHRQQLQRQHDAEVRYNKSSSSAWKPAGPPRDPSEIHSSRGVNLTSMMKQRYNQHQHLARPNPSAASYSQSSVSGSDSDFFPRE